MIIFKALVCGVDTRRVYMHTACIHNLHMTCPEQLGEPGRPQLVSKPTSCKTVNLKIKAVPLPQAVTRFLQENVALLRRLCSEGGSAKAAKRGAEGEGEETAADAVRNGLAEALEAAEDSSVGNVQAWLERL